MLTTRNKHTTLVLCSEIARDQSKNRGAADDDGERLGVMCFEHVRLGALENRLETGNMHTNYVDQTTRPFLRSRFIQHLGRISGPVSRSIHLSLEPNT